MTNVVRHRLANGLTLLVKPDTAAPVVALVTWVRAGYFDETDDVVGISHVLEHMYFKGTPTRGVGEIARETKSEGGYLNAHTIYDHTCYYAVVPSSGWRTALAIQADAYHHSTIDAGELGRELEVIIEEARRKADAPGAVATETLFALLHDRHRIRRWRIGTEAGLRRLTRDDVRAFYRSHYVPDRTVLCVVGDVQARQVIAEVERWYGQAPPAAPVPRDAGPQDDTLPGFRYRELDGDIAETEFVLGWRTPGSEHPDGVLLDQAALILGTGRASRLFRGVRDTRLASSIAAYHYTPDPLGIFVVHGESAPERMGDAIEATWQVVEALRAWGCTDAEVERARRLQESRWLRRLESMDGQALHLAEWESAGGWERAERWLARALEATGDEITAAVRRHLVPEQASLLTYRPRGATSFAPDVGTAWKRLASVPTAPAPLAAAPDARPPLHVVRRLVPESVQGATRVYRTAAGVPVLVRQKVGGPVAHVGMYLAEGAARDDEAHAGCALLAARTALRGTATRTAQEVAEATERLGAAITPGVSLDGAGWTLSVPAPRLHEGIDLLADVVLRCTLDPEALEVERAAALSELAQQRDDMYRRPLRLATEAAYDGHPYGRSAHGTEGSLGSLTTEAVRAWHAGHLTAGPWVIAAVTDGDPDDVAAALASRVESLRYRAPVMPPTPPWPASGRQRAEQRDKAQTAFTLLFEGPGRRDRDRHATTLLVGVASGLGGRLFEALRDRRSLCYTVALFPVERSAGGMIGAYIATSPDKEDEARAALLAELASFRDAPVTVEELSRATAYAIGSRAIALQSGGAQLSEVVDAWLYGEGLAEIETADARLREVTAADVQRIAGEWLRPDRMVEGIVRGTRGVPASQRPA